MGAAGEAVMELASHVAFESVSQWGVVAARVVR